MINKIKNLINLNNLDGYVVPKNDEFFTEYSKTNKLQIVANFTGSAGFILILKNSNHLFVDGRYTIQAKQQSGKKFIIHEMPFVWPKNILNKYKFFNIGFDPKIFTFVQNEKEKKIFLDFFLMRQCKYFIVGPTSFHWWAAWLCDHDNKIIVCPKNKDLNLSCNDDFWPVSWIKV